MIENMVTSHNKVLFQAIVFLKMFKILLN